VTIKSLATIGWVGQPKPRRTTMPLFLTVDSKFKAGGGTCLQHWTGVHGQLQSDKRHPRL